MAKIYPLVEAEDGMVVHLPPSGNEHDNLWLLLETGKYHVDAGEWQQGRDTFLEALNIIEALDEEALISLGAVASGSSAMAIDDRQADYVGTTYDRIMVPAYLALCELFLGNYEQAAVATRAMNEWQVRAEEARRAQIEQAAEEEAAASEQGIGDLNYSNFLSVANEDENVAAAYNGTYEGISEWATPAMADYSIPAGRVIGAIAHGAASNTGEFREMSAAVQRMVPSCREMREVLVVPGRSIVIFETGGVPHRVDDSQWFSYGYTYNGQVIISTAKIAIPALAYEGVASRRGLAARIADPEDPAFREYRRVDRLVVQADGGQHQSQFVGSLAGLTALEFQEALQGIWFREVIRVMVREVVQGAVSTTVADQYGTTGMLAATLVGAATKSMFEPDLRGWESLPAEHHILVFDTPADGKLTFQLSDGSIVDPTTGLGGITIENVPTDQPMLFFARSTRPGVLKVHGTSLAPRL